VRLLVERTKEATRRAIKAVAPGRPISVIGRVIESYARRFDYGVVRDFTGHGIGTSFHTGLVTPHYDDPRNDTVIETGMTFTIEQTPGLSLQSAPLPRWTPGPDFGGIAKTASPLSLPTGQGEREARIARWSPGFSRLWAVTRRFEAG